MRCCSSASPRRTGRRCGFDCAESGSLLRPPRLARERGRAALAGQRLAARRHGEAFDTLIERLDHHNLNDLISPSTAENLAMWFWRQLKDQLPLHAVEVYETPITKVRHTGA